MCVCFITYSQQSRSDVCRLEDRFLRGPVPRRPPAPGCRKHPICADGSTVPMAVSGEGSVERTRLRYVTTRPPPCLQVRRLLQCLGRWGRGCATLCHAGCRLPLTASPLGSVAQREPAVVLGRRDAGSAASAPGWGTAVPLALTPKPQRGGFTSPHQTLEDVHPALLTSSGSLTAGGCCCPLL